MTPAEKLSVKARSLMDDALALMEKKNHDYTGGSADPYANFRGASQYEIHPAIGIMIRMDDKQQRIRTFATRGKLEVDGEGLRDACIDLINYAALTYAMLTEGGHDEDTSD